MIGTINSTKTAFTYLVGQNGMNTTKVKGQWCLDNHIINHRCCCFCINSNIRSSMYGKKNSWWNRIE